MQYIAFLAFRPINSCQCPLQRWRRPVFARKARRHQHANGRKGFVSRRYPFKIEIPHFLLGRRHRANPYLYKYIIYNTDI